MSFFSYKIFVNTKAAKKFEQLMKKTWIVTVKKVLVKPAKKPQKAVAIRKGHKPKITIIKPAKKPFYDYKIAIKNLSKLYWDDTIRGALLTKAAKAKKDFDAREIIKKQVRTMIAVEEDLGFEENATAKNIVRQTVGLKALDRKTTAKKPQNRLRHFLQKKGYKTKWIQATQVQKMFPWERFREQLHKTRASKDLYWLIIQFAPKQNLKSLKKDIKEQFDLIYVKLDGRNYCRKIALRL